MPDETPMRDINTLLALDTYQGMTDEEINELMYYRVETATAEWRNLYEIAFDEGYQAGIKSRTNELVDYTKDLLDTLVAKPLKLKKVN